MFGSVVEGMGVLKRMEAMGSKSGKTARRVTIRDSGQVESRLQRALALAAEREELASFKRDPIAVDPDAEAAARMRTIRGEAAPDTAAADGAAVAGETAAAEAVGAGGKRKRDTDAGDDPESRSGDAAVLRRDGGGRAEAAVAASGSAGGATEAGGGGAAAAGEEGRGAGTAAVEGAQAGGAGAAGHGEQWEDEALAGLNPRQRRLLELKRKGQRARKANENAAVSEAKRDRKGPPDPNLERKKWMDQELKQKQVWSAAPAAQSLRIDPLLSPTLRVTSAAFHSLGSSWAALRLACLAVLVRCQHCWSCCVCCDDLAMLYVCTETE